MFQPLDERYHRPHDGEYVGMYVHPRPYQDPHPPVWLMSNTPGTYQHAGANGMNVIGMANPVGKIRTCWDEYQRAASVQRQRETTFGEGVGICVMIYVAESAEQAAEDIRESTNIFYEIMNGWRPSGEWALRSYLDDDEELTAKDRDGDWYDFLLAHDIVWAGSAEYVVEKIERFQEELGLAHIMLIEPFVGLPYEKILKSMTLFGERVIPRLKKEAVS